MEPNTQKALPWSQQTPQGRGVPVPVTRDGTWHFEKHVVNEQGTVSIHQHPLNTNKFTRRGPHGLHSEHAGHAVWTAGMRCLAPPHRSAPFYFCEGHARGHPGDTDGPL